MAKAKQQQTGPLVPLSTLKGLLGKPVDDPAVTTALAGAGKVKQSSELIIAKDAGFDFSLKQPEGAKRTAKKLLSTLFLFPEGGDGHRAYTDLPPGFSFSTRDALLAALPPPTRSWKIGEGEVPASTPGVTSDRWLIDGLDHAARYGKNGDVRNITIALTADALGGARLAVHPLHFKTRPADALPDADLTAMGLLVAWAADRFGLPAKHATTKLGKQLVDHAITPRAFLVEACNRTLTSLDVVPQLADFLGVYTGNVHSDDGGARDAAHAKIKVLLNLEGNEQRYGDDFLGTFATVLDNPFHVPDSWEAVARIAPIIDARLADFEGTRFRTAPNLTVYRNAVKARDNWTVQPARATASASGSAHTADAGIVDLMLTNDLIATIGKPLTDKRVKDILARAGMPIGKRIDQQANPALGVSYMGHKLEIDGKKVLGVEGIWFFADKQRSYIRGLGAEVELAGYPGPLPDHLRFGLTRDEVRALLGAPSNTSDDMDWFARGPELEMWCRYADGRLVVVHVGLPAPTY